MSSQATTTISINEDYLRITPPTIDATPLNYNAMFTDRTRINSSNSTFINTKESLTGTEILHNKIFKLHHVSLMNK